MKPTMHIFAVVGLLLQSVAAQAQGWHYNGFVNQTLINTSDNYMFGDTNDNLSFDYRELALIVTGSLSEQVEFSSQLLSRKAGNSDDGTPRIDYGFLSWRFYENVSWSNSFRLGRLKAPVGFYNDTRDSPFTRNGVFLPQSIYLDRVRNYIMRADELMYLGEWRSDQWTLNWKLAGGKNIPDVEELADSFRLPDSLQPNFSSARVWHFQFIAEYDGGRIRMGYSENDSPNNFSLIFPPISGVIRSSADSHWRILSFEYNALKWSFTTEVERAVFVYHGLVIDPHNPNYKDYPESGYGQFSWNLNQQHSIFIRKEVHRFNRNDPDGSLYMTFPTAALLGIGKIDRYGRSTTLGWSYRPAATWLIRLDISQNTGVMQATLRDAPKGFQPQKDWNMAALAVSWRF